MSGSTSLGSTISGTYTGPIENNTGTVTVKDAATISNGGDFEINEIDSAVGTTLTLENNTVISGSTFGVLGDLILDGGGINYNGGSKAPSSITLLHNTTYPNSISVADSIFPKLILKGFEPGDHLEINGVKITSVSVSDGILTIENEYSEKINTSVSKNYTTADFQKYLINGELVCFLAGSMISTPSGFTSVESLNVGADIIAYIDGVETTRRVTWAGQAHCTVRPHLPLDQAGYPVRVLKDAIADGVPFKDLLVTAEHCLFFDGKFVPVRMLVNGRSIFYDTSITSYDYYHIETEDHSVIMADGMLTESYLDTGNRRSFTQKGSVVSIGGSRNLSWGDAAASLSVSREAVEPLFRQLEARAERKAFSVQTEAQPLTHDHDLHLVTDTGATIRQIRENNGRVMFMIPAGVESVRVVSNTSRPCDTVGPFVDDRRTLGVLVGNVRLFEGNTTATLTAHLQDADLSGWNNVEDGTMRWTDGNALLNLGQRPIGSIALMALQIHAAGPYLLADTTSERAALQA
ncbi:Hint domain-containing protein [Gluconobacter cerinus]|uniref:Hint domain-containing protein n=1 Tax=Gluconobacter cerinus TaxID=38307 RepID=UPI0031FE8BAC